MTPLYLYSKLSTRSRRAIARIKRRNGQPYQYRPRGNLLRRLARETGWSVDQVYTRLMQERQIILRLFHGL